MKAYTLILLLFLALAIAPQPSYSQTTQHPIEFSAKVVRRDSSQKVAANHGMLYVGSEGIRTETHKNQQPVWMIFKPHDNRVWTLFPTQKLYMERTGLSMEWPPLPEDANSPCHHKKFRCQKTGWQQIDGRHVIHWRIDIVDKKGKLPYAQLWVDPRLNVAIREVYADGLTVEMQHIQEAPQKSTLFTLPNGYQKVTLPLNKKTTSTLGETAP